MFSRGRETTVRWLIAFAFVSSAWAQEVEVLLPTGTGVSMVLIPAGEFPMGAAEGAADQQPVHPVELKAFYIDKYEVTNAQYREYMRDTGYHPPFIWREGDDYNAPEQPVMDINWFEMQQYCNWAGKRLPAEAEWEKAARGTDGRRNPWGDEEPNANGEYRANYNDAGDRDADGFTFSAPVGSYPQGVSPYGVHDMVGNAKEWVGDWYDKDYYTTSPRQDPTGPEIGQLKVIRGGSWFDFGRFAYGTYRVGFNPELPDGDIGGRCAVNADSPLVAQTAVEGVSWGGIKAELAE
ncbi:MAG: SUMF1/EgtB/PvdO family nonheme iron enzyme [Candidatus Latescibacteria bacterium]|nr:SUMF1/EgtB/PvdO family nonheme iron enzyme [Candidatus Latescibacterota bacterium]